MFSVYMRSIQCQIQDEVVDVTKPKIELVEKSKVGIKNLKDINISIRNFII